MDVLQAADPVLGDGQAEIVLDALVPDTGQVLAGEVAFDHGPLEFEAEHDVQVVGDLVRLDADEIRLDQV